MSIIYCYIMTIFPKFYSIIHMTISHCCHGNQEQPASSVQAACTTARCWSFGTAHRGLYDCPSYPDRGTVAAAFQACVMRRRERILGEHRRRHSWVTGRERCSGLEHRSWSDHTSLVATWALWQWGRRHPQLKQSYQLIEARSDMYAPLNWVIIGSGNGLVPNRRQAIICTNYELLGTNFTEIWIQMWTFLLRKCTCKFYMQTGSQILISKY